ncbi:MAG TPA: lectin-like protein, partial [Bacteroidia bacterium]|nr:lectin-like protein [Bacteroidia bacterium]
MHTFAMCAYEGNDPQKQASKEVIIKTDPVTPSPLPPPNTCNIQDIIKKLTDDGNTLLKNIDTSCSLYFVNPQYLSGSDAQAYAQTFGANLVSIQSKAENDAIVAALVAQGFGGKVIWIGLGDEKVEGTFEWYDGAPLLYTNWALNEPNNGDPDGENCVQIYPADGKWNDLACGKYNSLSVIEVNLCPQTIVIPSDANPICLGATVTLDAKTILGAPNYTYIWSSSPSGFTSNSASPTVNPKVNTTYSVNVTDRYGCTSQSSISVSVNEITTNITTSGPTSFCDGDSIILTASAGDKYEWSTGDTTQNITVFKSGTYSVKITKGVCYGTSQKTVTV